MTGIGLGLRGVLAIGLPLVLMSPAGSQPGQPSAPNSANPSSPTTPGGTPATETAPGTPGSSPSVESQQPAIPGAEQNQPSPSSTTRPSQLAIGRHQPSRVERRGPTEGYVTSWSGPHVIEQTIGFREFLIEGSWVTAWTICPRWEAGDRARFVVHASGACTLYNRTRHRSCPVSCETYPGWYKF